MKSIPLHLQIRVSRAEFERVTSLAASSRRGCREARAALQNAKVHGLHRKPYAVVRQRGRLVLAGWEGGRVTPLRVSGGVS